MNPKVQPDGSIQFYPVRRRLLLLLAGAIGFVALGFVILNWREELLPIRVYHAAAAVAAILFFGLCAVEILRRILWHSPVVVLSQQGIQDCTSFFAVGFVPWEDIAYISTYKIEKQPMLGLYLKDADSIIARVGAVKAAYMKLNRHMGFAPMSIPQVTMPMPLEELAELIRMTYRIERRPGRDYGSGAKHSLRPSIPLDKGAQAASSRSKNDR